MLLDDVPQKVSGLTEEVSEVRALTLADVEDKAHQSQCEWHGGSLARL